MVRTARVRTSMESKGYRSTLDEFHVRAHLSAVRRIWKGLSLLLFLALVLLGCGKFFVNNNSTSTGGSSTTDTIYVANANSSGVGSVSAFTVNSSGKPSAVGSNLPAGNGVSSLAVNSQNQVLYIGDTAGGASGFSIASGGGLTSLSGSPFASGSAPVALATGTSSSFLYLLEGAPSPSVIVYSINTSTGVLTQQGTSAVLNTTSIPSQVRISPNGSNLYVALGSNSGVAIFTINSDGSLTSLSNINPVNGASAFDIAFTPKSTFAFVADGASGVDAYSIQSGGGLSLVSGSPFAAGVTPVALTVDTSGQFLYVANQGLSGAGGNVSAFVIGVSGALTQISGSPFTAGSAPTGILADPHGSWLYVANENGSPDVSIFSIGSSGALSSTGSVSTGGSSIAIATTH